MTTSFIQFTDMNTTVQKFLRFSRRIVCEFTLISDQRVYHDLFDVNVVRREFWSKSDDPRGRPKSDIPMRLSNWNQFKASLSEAPSNPFKLNSSNKRVSYDLKRKQRTRMKSFFEHILILIIAVLLSKIIQNVFAKYLIERFRVCYLLSTLPTAER